MLMIQIMRIENGKAEATDPGIVPVGTEPRLEHHETGLVLTAMGIPTFRYPGRDTLFVRAQDLGRAQKELLAYEEENRAWPVHDTAAPPKHPGSQPVTLLFFSLLVLFATLTGPWQSSSPWFSAGAIDTRMLFEHRQWYRLITALTLHADVHHLLGNCLIGGSLVYFLCQTTGQGLGWFLLLLGGATGNFLNVMLRGGDHLSVGFSTAVFAAIGICSGLQIRLGKGVLRSLLLALGAGLSLLAFLGTEGARTDLGAHFFGFCSGLLIGLPVPASSLPPGLHWQRLLLAFSVLIVATAWYLAINRPTV